MNGHTPVVLFVDLLGVRSKWLTEGRTGAEHAFEMFRNLIAGSLRDVPKEDLLHGLVETDAAGLMFSNVGAALNVGCKLFRFAFSHSRRNENNRTWLRGCIVPCADKITKLRHATSFDGSLSQVGLMLYDNSLLDAISVEKSGYKGMRLLVAKSLVTASVINARKFNVGNTNFIPLKKLRNSIYPKRVADDFVDFLWMADPNDNTSLELHRLMAHRLRLSAANGEEFVHAAATQVVFHECDAIMNALRGRHLYNLREEREIKAKASSVAGGEN